MVTKKNMYNERKQDNDLSKYKSKGEAIFKLNVIKGLDYDGVVDYVNDNWDKSRIYNKNSNKKELNKLIKAYNIIYDLQINNNIKEDLKVKIETFFLKEGYYIKLNKLSRFYLKRVDK